MRYKGAINKPGFNPLGAQTTTTFYNLYIWGSNNQGQLGLGNTTNYSSPKQVGSLNWSFVAGGTLSSFAIKPDGTLWAWGYGGNGVLGLGNTTNYSSPKQVGALTNWKTIYNSKSGYNTVAVKTDGTLWVWGLGTFGTLGLGNTTSYSSPKQVGSLTNWSKSSVDGYTCLAIKTDGSLWSWGANTAGQLGLGNTTYYSSPKQVGVLTTWVNVVSGPGSGVLAIKTDGTLWAWGSSTYGKLGLNNVTDYYSPKQVGALTTWSSISMQYYAGGALKTNGTLWTWGYNLSGQLGLGTSGAGTYTSSPQQVGALTDWSTISAGAQTFFSIKTNGTLWAIGGPNGTGVLGLGDTTNRSSPNQIGALTSWLSVGAGAYHTLALG
jgi:alpha-tubulin suppressor-like RCC1 family protein